MKNWQHFATFKIGGRKITAPQFQLLANPNRIQASADSSPPMDQTDIMNTQHLFCATTCAVGCGQLFRPNEGTGNMLMRVLAMTSSAIPPAWQATQKPNTNASTQTRRHSQAFSFVRVSTNGNVIH